MKKRNKIFDHLLLHFKDSIWSSVFVHLLNLHDDTLRWYHQPILQMSTERSRNAFKAIHLESNKGTIQNKFCMPLKSILVLKYHAFSKILAVVYSQIIHKLLEKQTQIKYPLGRKISSFSGNQILASECRTLGLQPLNLSDLTDIIS